MLNIKLVICAILLFNLNFISAQKVLLKKKKNHYIYVDENGEKIFKKKFRKAKIFNDGLAAVLIDDKWGYINKKGELVILNQYDYASNFIANVAYVKTENAFSIINNKGQHLSESYDSIYRERRYYILKKMKVYGIADSSGSLIEEPIFDRIGSYHNGKLTIQKDSKWGTWKKGRTDFSNAELFLEDPEEMPLFSKKCEMIKEKKERKSCSDRAMAIEMYQNVKYPLDARNKGISGTVVVRFIIDKNGKVFDAKIIRGIGGGCEEEVLRVVNENLHTWFKPGMQDGMEVNTVFYLPMRFSLE